MTSADALRTQPRPNRFGVDHEGRRPWCTWPWDTLVLTCDGTVVCGCGDGFNVNRMGSVDEGLLGVWRGEGFQRMRAGFLEGRPEPFCIDCGLMQLHDEGWRPPDAPRVPDRAPRVLYVEPTIVCNLRCPQPACVPADVYPTRARRMLDLDVYTRAIDELGPELERLVLYNYGESFIHPRVFDMIRHAKSVNPRMWIWTSTNGHHFDSPERIAEVVDSGINEIQFSIDGSSQEVYERYRVGGNLDKVFRAIRGIVEERDRRGWLYPRVLWAYILFRWNDSDEEMRRAVRLAEELGVDRLFFTLTDQPAGAPSTRILPGSEAHTRWRHAIVGASEGLPNALRWSGRVELVEAPTRFEAGNQMTMRARVTNDGERPWPGPRAGRLRTVVIRGRLLDPETGDLAHDDVIASVLPGPVAPGESIEVALSSLLRAHPGRYLLDVDLVLEGLWWFQDCVPGSSARVEVDVVEREDPAPWLEVLEASDRIDARGDLRARVRLRNVSRSPFGSEDGYQVTCRWSAEGSDDLVAEAGRVSLEPPLEPGETRDLDLAIKGGTLGQGRWRGRIALVQEPHRWHDELGVSWTVEVDPEETPRVRIRAIDPPHRIASDATLPLRLEIENVGGRPVGAPDLEGLGLRWFPEGSDVPSRDVDRRYLEVPIEPGERRVVAIEVTGAEIAPGRYRILVDLVREHAYWFGSVGSEDLELELEVG